MLERLLPDILNYIYRLLEKMVADPHHLYEDPDPASHFNADPDPAFYFNADPNPAPHQSDGNLRPLVTDPPGLHRASTALHNSILSL
jgi:hypothetical protein